MSCGAQNIGPAFFVNKFHVLVRFQNLASENTGYICTAMTIMMLGFLGCVIALINKVISGHGLDYYICSMGYALNDLGVLILVIFVPFVLALVWVIKWYQEKDERDFNNPY